MEPGKWEEWNWFDWDNLPEPIFIPIKNLRSKNYNPLN
jgi:8-oxo-dGTP diphosphatase